jgi:hypothetical protein
MSQEETMELRDESKALCVMSLPWALYQHNALPQGIKPATNIFQERIEIYF